MDAFDLAILYARICILALPLFVFFASGRRLLMSTSGNAVLYAMVCGFAAVAALAATPGTPLGPAVESAGTVMGLAALPLWLVVREHCRRPEDIPYAHTIRPVFASHRERDIREPLALPPEARVGPPPPLLAA